MSANRRKHKIQERSHWVLGGGLGEGARQDWDRGGAQDTCSSTHAALTRRRAMGIHLITILSNLQM